MATPNVVPRADQEGGLGTSAKSWGKLFIENPASGGTAAATISNLDVDQLALDINATANTTGNIVEVTSSALTTGDLLYMIHAGSALESSGRLLFIKHLDTGPNANVTTSNEILYTTSVSTTGTSTKTNLELSMQNTGNGNTGTIIYTGLYNNMTIWNNGGVGDNNNITQYAIHNKILYGTVAKNVGLYSEIADGGMDVKFVSSADTGDFFSIATGAAGATTITTVDDDAAAAHMTFTIDGDMVFSPAGTVTFNTSSLSIIDDTTSSATQGGKLILAENDGAVMADNHRLGVIEFKGAEDTSNTLSIGARIQAIAQDAWDGSNNDADLEFYTTNGTTESLVLKLDAAKAASFAGRVVLNTDSSVLFMGVDNDVSFTHDGTSGLTIAATPISIDSTGSLDLSSTTGDINFQDGGTNQIAFEMDAVATEVAIQQKVNGDDLVFKQYDGAECARVHDGAGGGSADFGPATAGYGFGIKRPVYIVSAGGGTIITSILAQNSGAIFACDASANSIVFTLPAGTEGLTYTIALTRANGGSTTIGILTNGAAGDNLDNFYLTGINNATAYSDYDGDTISIPSSAVAGTRVTVTCIKSGSNEMWLAEAYSSANTLLVIDS